MSFLRQEINIKYIHFIIIIIITPPPPPNPRKKKKVILYYADSLYQLISVRYGNFRKCGTRFYPERSGEVRYKVLVMA